MAAFSSELGSTVPSQEPAAAGSPFAAKPPPSSLPALLEDIKKTRDSLKDEIEELSRDVAPDADTWISQAEKLQADIQKSRATAREIVREAEEATRLRAAQEDAAQKVNLLNGEISFSQQLESVLLALKDVANKISNGKEALIQGEPSRAFGNYQEAEAGLAELRPVEHTTALDLLQQRAEVLRREIAEQAEQSWHRLLRVERKHPSICIQLTENGGGSDLGLEQVTELLLELNLLDQKISRFGDDLDSLIVRPRMTLRNGKVADISITDRTLSVAGWKSNDGAPSCIDDVTAIMKFLNMTLPQAISTRLSEVLMPLIASRLTSQWLPSSIPTSLSDVPQFQEMLDKVSQLSSEIEEIGWTGGAELDDWVKQAPRHWLSKRRELALASVRSSLANSLLQTKTVERVETQVISKDDVMAATNAPAEDWDSGWTEEETNETKPDGETAQGDEEDVSAWEVDDEADGNSKARDDNEPQPGATGEDDDADAWGWDEEQKSPTNPSSPVVSKTAPKPNGFKPENQGEDREVTLRETFTVTEVPDELRDLITSTARDAENLKQESLASSAVAGAATGLLSLPTLVLAGYRALGPTYYVSLDGGNMFLYNDSIRLAAELSDFASHKQEHSISSQTISKMKLDNDIASLESFARRAYAKEMDSQRTILRDLLDGAQGFADCTQQPFSAACDAAVSGAVDHVRGLADRWRSILSQSALLQSLGSLLATVMGKIILDVEDMADISEEESKRLKGFCNDVAKLSELFVVQDDAGGEKSDMSGVYAANWFKFQYLSEIMESSLADIKYLWTEGELKLEFEVEELVDLIEALFADSDHRRRAIGEIRRS